MNPDPSHGINVAVEVAAIVLRETGEMKEIKTPVITNAEIPFLSD